MKYLIILALALSASAAHADFDARNYQVKVEAAATELIAGTITVQLAVMAASAQGQALNQHKAQLCWSIGSINPTAMKLFNYGSFGDRSSQSRSAVSQILKDVEELNSFCGGPMKIGSGEKVKLVSNLTDISSRLADLQKLAQKISSGEIK